MAVATQAPEGLSSAPPSGLPLPAAADLAFWRGEVDRAEQGKKKVRSAWQDNIRWYTGESPDATRAATESPDFVNVNVDFYQVEQKIAQLFYDTPELQAKGTGPLTGHDDIVQAHRDLLNELLAEVDVLERAILPAIKDCLAVSGVGPVVLGYQPTLRTVAPPIQPGSILGLQGPVQVPIYQQWYALRFSPDKLLIPADWHSTDWDLAPWLGMRFRMPLALARREFSLPPDFAGTSTRDEHVLDDDAKSHEATGLNYVDGQILFYKASVFDESADHPELYRELVLIDGLDREARHRDCPHQTILPDGRLTADSLIGNPIHPLSIRSVPDSAYTPADAQMTRPLVRELCRFRTQMVQERDANRPRWLYDTDKFPPEVLTKLQTGEVGALIGLEGGALSQGASAILAPITPGTSPRQTYIANDYIEKDIAKVLAIGPNQTSVGDDQERSATEISVIDRAANVRLDAERRAVLRWYLRLVDKFSALVCRYMTPDVAARYIGPQAAQTWAQWDKRATDSRVAFQAKPDSQIRLDSATERRFALQLYQMVANDPNAVRVELLKNLFTKAGYDPARLVVDTLPEKTPEPNISFRFAGEDLYNPMVREILAQGGIQVSQQAIDQAAGQLYQQVALGLRDARGKAVPARPRLAEHGGPAQPVRSLSQQQGDETGQRPGPSMAMEGL